MLKPGDRILIKKIRGLKLLQELICWKTNSRFSHVEYILDREGNSIDFRVPRAVRNNIKTYFNGQWRVCLIRPNFGINAAWLLEASLKIGRPYDILSYLGFALNKPLQDKYKINCAEAQLICDQKAGQFLQETGYLVSPQTYWDYTVAGKFSVVWQKDCPDKYDFIQVREDKDI